MLYVLAVALGILAGMAAGGKLSNLWNFKFQKPWLAVAAFLLQAFAQVSALKGFKYAVEYSFAIQGAVFCMLFAVFWFNRRYLGVIVISAGCILNALVMMLNGGKMPVSAEVLLRKNLDGEIELFKSGGDGKHILMNETTKLWFLGDIIGPPPFFDFMMKIISIGDIIVIAGLFIMTAEAVIGKKPENN